MYRFLLRLAAFLAVAATACLALFVVVVLLNRHAVGACQLGDDVDSVIVGDSHTAWAIDDAGMPGLRNVSLNAEGYKYTYLKLQHLLSSDQHVKRIYLAFSYANLSGYYDDYITGATFRMFADRYLGVLSARDYVELVRNSPRTAPDLFRRLLRGGLSTGLHQKCTLYGNFFNDPAIRRFETFRPEVMEKRIVEQYYLRGELQAQSALNLDYLEKIIRLVRQHGIELVTLNTPLHPEYERRVPAQFREMYARVLERHSIPSFDFADLKLGDADFLPDGDHTNYPGAMLASRRFAEYHRTHPVHAGAARD
jgi:hypothetical protein